MKCNMCESEILKVYSRLNNRIIYKCKSCHHMFVYPIKNNIETQKLYSDSENLNKIKDVIQNHKITKMQKYYFNQVLETSKNLTNKKNLNILEIGSSIGTFLKYAQEKKHIVIGTEVNKEIVNIVNKEGIIKLKYVENNYTDYFNINSFDLIYLEHVLEHLHNPNKILKQLTQLLNKNGIIIIKSPNHNSLLSLIFNKFWTWTYSNRHLNFFNKKSYQQILKNCGLKLISYKTGDYFVRSIPQFWSIFTIQNYTAYLLNYLFSIKIKLIRMGSKKQTILNLFPYYILYPIIKLSHKFEMGSESTIITQRKW